MANLLNSIIYYLKDAIVKNSNNDVELPNELYLDNSKQIYGKTTGLDTDVYLGNFQPLSGANNCVLGFGGYDSQIGKTNIYGNDINVFCNNTIRFDKSIAFAGHSSVMGTVINSYLSSAKSCNSGTWVALCNATVPAGIWIAQYGVRWPTSETGVRQANVSSTSGNNTQQITAKPIGGTTTQVRWTEILSLNSDTTLYLNAYHNHGSALTLPASSSGSGSYMRFIRIL